MADSLAEIFMLTPREELREQAYQMLDVTNNRDFALAVEERLNQYFKENRKLDKRSILKVREEMDGAAALLEQFLKAAGLSQETVENFIGKNIRTKTEGFAKAKTIRRKRSKSDTSESGSSTLSTYSDFEFSSSEVMDENGDSPKGYRPYMCKRQGRKNRKRAYSGPPGSSTNTENEFSDSSAGSEAGFLAKKFKLSSITEANQNTGFSGHSTKYAYQSDNEKVFVPNREDNKENRQMDLKRMRKSSPANSDEFSDMDIDIKKIDSDQDGSVKSDDSDALNNMEFSSADHSDGFSVADEVVAFLNEVHLSELGQQFYKTYISKDDTVMPYTRSNTVPNTLKRTRST